MSDYENEVRLSDYLIFKTYMSIVMECQIKEIVHIFGEPVEIKQFNIYELSFN